MLTPRAKSENYTGIKFCFNSSLTVFINNDITKKVYNTLKIFTEPSGISLSVCHDRSKADIVLCLDTKLADKTERYTISVCEKGAYIRFAEFLGGRNAAATLMQLIRYENGSFCILGAKIDDWSDNRMRGVLLDPARRYIDITELKDIMRQMALTKMNVAHMHLMDASGYAFESKAYPELNEKYSDENNEHASYRKFTDKDFSYYTFEEMRDIIAYGQAIGVDLLPEIELTTHGYHMLQKLPFMRCETEHTAPSEWAMCVSNPAFYEVFSKIIEEVASVFPYPVIHVGTDELNMYDLTERRTWPTWYDCKHCKKLAAELGIKFSSYEDVAASQADGTFKDKGIDGTNELFTYTVHRIHEMVSKAGKRMMMWNDNIDIAKPCDLPKDILIHFWRIAGEWRGPREGCSMQGFLDAGFEVINSHYPQTYIEEDFYKPEVPVSTWAPKVYPPSKDEHKDQILGGWPSAWGNYHHSVYTLPSLLALYADRLWDETPGVYEKDFCISTTRTLLGIKTPENFNVYDALGGYILPKDTSRTHALEDCRKGHVDKVTISADEVANTVDTLKNMADDTSMEGRLASVYADCAAWVHERMTK